MNDQPRETAQRLARWNRWRLRAPLTEAGDAIEPAEESRLQALQSGFVELEIEAVRDRAASAPHDADAFVAWFECLRETGPGQNDPLFPWLETTATLCDLRWFLSQEVAGEAGFDDLVALTQVKLTPIRAKLELARNYWDEMGRGRVSAMHGPMLARLASALALDPDVEPVWEAVALGNLMVALATDRRWTLQSVGALGVIELTAPWRAARVNLALKRLAVSPKDRQYYALHATLDVQHSASWNREVLAPIVAADPRAARPLAEGALMRLRAGQRCFERYRRELWRAAGGPNAPAPQGNQGNQDDKRARETTSLTFASD
jgi:hypothetical protein